MIDDMRRTTRRIRYVVAVSLDGFIAGPKGEADWILIDPDLDFDEFNSRFDTILMGRRTYRGDEGGRRRRLDTGNEGLCPHPHPSDRTITPTSQSMTIRERLVAELRAQPGKDVWLFGGGSLFRSLAQRRLVDTVEVAVIPVLLADGIRSCRHRQRASRSLLTGHTVYAKTGTVMLEYVVQDRRRTRPRRT